MHKHVLDFMISLPLCLMSTERPAQKATNSELRRWFDRHSVEVNGKVVPWNHPVPEKWESLVLHPHSKSWRRKVARRTTIW